MNKSKWKKFEEIRNDIYIEKDSVFVGKAQKFETTKVGAVEKEDSFHNIKEIGRVYSNRILSFGDNLMIIFNVTVITGEKDIRNPEVYDCDRQEIYPVRNVKRIEDIKSETFRISHLSPFILVGDNYLYEWIRQDFRGELKKQKEKENLVPFRM